MKSIIYVLITIMVCSIVISAFPKYMLENKQNITIQCVDDNCSQEKLKLSAAIIKSRLVNYGLKDVAVVIDTASSCISVSTNQHADFKNLTALLTAKGKFEFYESYDRSVFIEKSGKDSELTSILNIPADNMQFSRFSGMLGYCKVDKKSEVELYIKNHFVNKPEYEVSFYWGEFPSEEGDFYLYILNQHSVLDNSAILGSSVQTGASGKQPELMVAFNKKGSSIWSTVTKRNIDKAIAIVLDKKVLYAPVVKSEITGGQCSMTGNFTLDEISQMSSLINSKELPLNFELKK